MAKLHKKAFVWLKMH